MLDYNYYPKKAIIGQHGYFELYSPTYKKEYRMCVGLITD